MPIKVEAKLRPWAAMRALAGEMADIAELLRMLEGEGFSVSTRYGDGTAALPDPGTMCQGDCEGMGCVPIDCGILPEGHPLREAEEILVEYSPEDIEKWRQPWLDAEAKEPTDDGWHFLKCPECRGTGKRLGPVCGPCDGRGAVPVSLPGGDFSSRPCDDCGGVGREAYAEPTPISAVRAGRKTIVFDFDGTIAEELEFPAIGEPIWETIEMMRAAKDAGIEVVIQSCRWSVHELSTEESAAENMFIAKDWLAAHDVPYDRLQAGKPLAELYVDDKACHVNDLQKLGHAISEMASQHPVDGSLTVRAFGDKHEWGCLMLEAPDDLAKEVIAWGEKNVPEDALYHDEKDPGGHGREKQVHATVSYGLEPSVTPDRLRDAILAQGVPIKVRLGKVSKFDQTEKGYDVIKFEVDSQDLRALHDAIEKGIGTPGNTFPDYKPHMTVAYVKPGSCDHLLGQEPFAGRELELGRFDYGRPKAPGEKDVHDYLDLFTVEAFLANKFDDLREAAIKLIEDDPTWKSLLADPASAQAYGQLQQSIRDARSEEELRVAWEAHMELPWETVVAESGGRKK